MNKLLFDQYDDYIESLQKYIKYLNQKKYKNDIEKQAEKDLTELCHFLSNRRTDEYWGTGGCGAFIA